jgi:hypothetical protein
MPRAQKGKKLKRQLSDGEKKTMLWRLDARQTLFLSLFLFFSFGWVGGGGGGGYFLLFLNLCLKIDVLNYI